MLKKIPEVVIVPVASEVTPLPAQNNCTDLRTIRINEYLAARNLAPLTQKAYRQDLNYFLRWTDTAWASVDARMITNFKKYLTLQKFGKKQKVLSNVSVRRILGTLHNFFDWMYKNEYIVKDPTIAVELPSLPEPEAKNLSDETFNNILDTIGCSTYPERNLALIAVLCHGLRPSEPSNLDIKDYDGRRLHIRFSKHDSKGYVPLDDWAKKLLDDYLNWRQSKEGVLLLPESPLFLSHSNRNAGQRISYETVRKLVEKIRKQTGIYFHAHQFRHTFATNLVLEGMNPYHVMTLTRHKSVSNFRRYTKAADQAAADNAFYEHMKNKRSKQKT